MFSEFIVVLWPGALRYVSKVYLLLDGPGSCDMFIVLLFIALLYYGNIDRESCAMFSEFIVRVHPLQPRFIFSKFAVAMTRRTAIFGVRCNCLTQKAVICLQGLFVIV